jgi:uncharacterized protein with GYD domain
VGFLFLAHGTKAFQKGERNHANLREPDETNRPRSQDCQECPRRNEESIGQLEKVGGKVLAFYMVMGEYDYVSIAEAPSDAVAMTFMMQLSAAGNVRTTTLRAFTREQGVEMIRKLPRPSRK